MHRTAMPAIIALLTTAVAVPCSATMCTVDHVPAATLLVPYFEVDLGDPDGIDTVVTIHNAAPAPALTHLIFWTDWAAPTIDFDLYLAGYDSVSFSLRQIFAGNIPITADEASDPTDTISPNNGPPEWDGSFANCQNFFPFFINPVIQGTALDRLTNGHQGQPVASLGGACLGKDHGDTIARGFITIDNATECSLVLDPGSTSEPYFADGGAGVASNVNQLWGDVLFYNGNDASASMLPLVHIEADSTFDSNSTSSNYTFYGRYTFPEGRDNREPLGSSWTVHFERSGGDLAEFIVWRDPTINDLLPAGAPCGVGPSWLPLGKTQVVCFDQETRNMNLCTDPAGPSPFPLATQRVPFDSICGPSSSPPFVGGWCQLNLNFDDGSGIAGDVDFPTAGGPVSQSAAFVVKRSVGIRTAFEAGTAIAHACTTDNPIICLPEDTDCDAIPDVDDPDDDNDTVPDVSDIDPLDPTRCRDLDGDTCDDCSVVNPPDPANDGTDGDFDGLCDAGDACPGDPDPGCVPVTLQSLEVAELARESGGPVHSVGSTR